MKEHWSKEDALTLKRMKKKKWARLDEDNTIVEFIPVVKEILADAEAV